MFGSGQEMYAHEPRRTIANINLAASVGYRYAGERRWTLSGLFQGDDACELRAKQRGDIWEIRETR
jgi:hypothetical protein